MCLPSEGEQAMYHALRHGQEVNLQRGETESGKDQIAEL